MSGCFDNRNVYKIRISTSHRGEYSKRDEPVLFVYYLDEDFDFIRRILSLLETGSKTSNE